MLHPQMPHRKLAARPGTEDHPESRRSRRTERERRGSSADEQESKEPDRIGQLDDPIIIEVRGLEAGELLGGVCCDPLERQDDIGQMQGSVRVDITPQEGSRRPSHEARNHGHRSFRIDLDVHPGPFHGNALVDLAKAEEGGTILVDEPVHVLESAFLGDVQESGKRLHESIGRGCHSAREGIPDLPGSGRGGRIASRRTHRCGALPAPPMR